MVALFHEHVWEFKHTCQIYPLFQVVPDGQDPEPPTTLTTEICTVCGRRRLTEWLGHISLEQLKPAKLLHNLKLGSTEA